ncbi:MAG: AMP-binding protein [Nitrospira sp.]|nr:AMP-binding protein [Nitrospira sp.]
MQHVAVHPLLDSMTTDDVTTLPELLRRRCRRSPEREAYRQCEAWVWRRYSWRDVEELVARWQVALAGENLASGDRVSVLFKNSVDWVCYDLEAQSMGLVVVPLYTVDHAENTANSLADSGVRLLLVGYVDQLVLLRGSPSLVPSGAWWIRGKIRFERGHIVRGKSTTILCFR